MTEHTNNLETTINSAFKQALAYFQQGHRGEAETLALKILKSNPTHDGAHCLLGLAAIQHGQYDIAEQYFGHAIAHNPNEAFYHFHLGTAIQLAGKPEAAVSSYEQSIKIRPDYADAYNNLANALRGLGRLEEAMTACERAIELMPRSAEAHYNHGNLLSSLDRKEDALLAYAQAIQLRPEHAETYYHRGNILRDHRRYAEAVESYEQAIRFRPNYLEALNNLGALLRELGQPDRALAACKQTIQPGQKSAEPYNNLGNILRELDRLEEAVGAYEKAIQLNPEHAQAYISLSVVLKELGRLDEALTTSEEAICLCPENAEAHNNHAMFLLQHGDFRNGWREYEWRKQMEKYPRRKFHMPLWDGSPLHGKTILLHAEQGYGDSIQFIRFLQQVAQAGARIIVECQPPLLRLFSCLPDVAVLIAQGTRVPPFDFHAPLMSLPYILGTTLDSIPNTTPYLFAPPSSHIAELLGIDRKKKNIGITWAGNPKNPGRSIDILLFQTLMEIPGIRWFSLQVGASASDISKITGMDTVIDASPHLGDFCDTASLIENLDLVISVDTAVAHLAGAMGKPTWLLLLHTPEWRWLMNRQDSLWYPSMRLFLQPKHGDWQGVLTQIRLELAQ